MDKETNELLKEISDAKNIIVSKKRELKNHLLKVAKERLEGAVIIEVLFKKSIRPFNAQHIDYMEQNSL